MNRLFNRTMRIVVATSIFAGTGMLAGSAAAQEGVPTDSVVTFQPMVLHAMLAPGMTVVRQTRSAGESQEEEIFMVSRAIGRYSDDELVSGNVPRTLRMKVRRNDGTPLTQMTSAVIEEATAWCKKNKMDEIGDPYMRQHQLAGGGMGTSFVLGCRNPRLFQARAVAGMLLNDAEFPGWVASVINTRYGRAPSGEELKKAAEGTYLEMAAMKFRVKRR